MFIISAPPLCANGDTEVSSSFGAANFDIHILSDNEERSGNDMLLGSESYNIIMPSEYILIHDFILEDGSAGGVELMMVNFTVNVPVTAVFYVIDIRDESVEQNGVSSSNFAV